MPGGRLFGVRHRRGSGARRRDLDDQCAPTHSARSHDHRVGDHNDHNHSDHRTGHHNDHHHDHQHHTSTSTSTSTSTDPTAVLTAEQLAEYMTVAAAFEQAAVAWLIPDGIDPTAGGAPGFTRYVFRDTSAGVVPTLVEGPLGPQVRCQDPDLPCSYLALRDLLASGDPVPGDWGMGADELATLVGELDGLNTFLDAHQDVDTACAEGFVPDRIQTPNMGSHFYRVDWMGDGFDPGRPEILLYALADDSLPDGALGRCVDGAWDGEPMKLVGSAFLKPPSVVGTDHPEGFTGNLDNWHSHLNLCRGNEQGSDTFVTRDECEEAGGNFHETLGWMIHAWVEADHDSRLGAFSMWNPSIAPLVEPGSVLGRRRVQGDDFPPGARQSIITNFAFEAVIEVEVGQSVYFNNSDSVPHTVTAGTPDSPDMAAFDSGILNPGDNIEFETSVAGTFRLFCALHNGMSTTVVVR